MAASARNDRVPAGAVGIRVTLAYEQPEDQPARSMMRIRYDFLDGLRGLAACQVVLLHYFAAFLPVAAGVMGQSHSEWDAFLRSSPLFMLFDGYSAVYVFFLISGFVLTIAFGQSTVPLPRLVASRLTRLFIPTIVSACLSLWLLVAWPHSSGLFFALTGSDWLNGLVKPSTNPFTIARDIIANATFLGYEGASVLRGDWLSSITSALNPPLWTLSIEAWGSLLILLLCKGTRPLTRVAKTVIAFVAILFVFGATELSLFLIGHILCLWRDRLPRQPRMVLVPLCLFMAVAGVYFCVAKTAPALVLISEHLHRFSLFAAPDEFQLASEGGATLIFLSVLLSGSAQKALSMRFFQRLGAISFSLYLVHFPILLLVSAPLFIAVEPHLTYFAAALAACTIGMTLTFLVAAAYHATVDGAAIRLARRINATGFLASPPSEVGI